MRVEGRQKMPHLFSGLIAFGLAVTVLFAAERAVIHLENTTVHSTAPNSFSLKNQGVAFQRAAAHAANVFQIYGSSELLVPAAPERGNIFFRTAPTGFQLSPVGVGGANPLTMLQKVGALGLHLRGKKVAVSLSPGWFFTAKPSWQGYKGNFSPMAASEMTFGTALELQDHLAALRHIRREIKPAPELHSEILDWPKLIARADSSKITDVATVSTVPGRNAQIPPGSRDVGFRSGVNASPIWIDLELLLRALTQVHARPLILSMPIGGDFYDHAGVSRSAREAYYTKLRALVQRYHFAVADFEEHDEDPAFLIRHQSHLTSKGWIYYNRVLDDFFHGRLPRS